MKASMIIILLLALTSCSSYIDRIHQQLDKDIQKERSSSHRLAKKGNRRRKNDNFDLYRNSGRQLVNNDKTVARSSKNNRFISPKTKRHYRPMEKAKKRYTAEDLKDSGNGASLWSDNSNQLFYRDIKKRNGDIILINVLKSLKSEITLELKRAFPESTNKKKKDAKVKKEENKEKTKPATAEEPVSVGKVHDRISSVVIEEISQDHLLLRGRKTLLYKNAKRLVEIQALVTRKDISEEDTINSDSILETTVNVLR